MSFVFEIVENVMEKEENAGNQHSFHFPCCFQKKPASESQKLWLVW